MNICVGIYSNGQGLRIKNNDLFKTLYRDQFNPVSIINHDINLFFAIKDNPRLSEFTHHLIKNKDKLYIVVERTGRVYEVEKSDQDTIQINRIDSTHYYGYNGGAILFSFNDTIFSFGGNGFWHNNGQLRYFSFKNHEWQITQIEKEIPCIYTLFYKDDVQKCLYYLTLPMIDEVTGKKQNNASICKLDLINRTNTELGEISDYFLKLLTENSSYYSFVSLSSLGGLLVNFNIENQYLVLFDKNEIYKSKSPIIKDAFFGNSEKRFPIFSFSTNNKIFYVKNKDKYYKVDSVKFVMGDFEKTSYSVYEKSITAYKEAFSYLLLLFCLIITSIFYIYFKKKNRSKGKMPIEDVLDDTSVLRFNEIEKDLINKMIAAIIEKRQLNAEVLNAALGLAKKSLEIQKKGRTEAINRINHKFKVLYNVNSDLIERVRSEQDRRFYNYVINEENMKLISGEKKLNIK